VVDTFHEAWEALFIQRFTGKFTPLTEAEQEAIGMHNLPELPVSAEELEKLLERLGAEIQHPVQADPVAIIDGKIVAFWVE